MIQPFFVSLLESYRRNKSKEAKKLSAPLLRLLLPQSLRLLPHPLPRLLCRLILFARFFKKQLYVLIVFFMFLICYLFNLMKLLIIRIRLSLGLNLKSLNHPCLRLDLYPDLFTAFLFHYA